MHIKPHARPPMYDEIVALFPTATERGVLFCWSDTIFIPKPDSQGVSPQLMVHEDTHRIQQGDDPAGWWQKYLVSPQFRLEQEIEAHKAEYAFVCEQPGATRFTRRMARNGIAKRLSSSLYCHMISFDRASKLLSAHWREWSRQEIHRVVTA